MMYAAGMFLLGAFIGIGLGRGGGMFFGVVADYCDSLR